ncbi:MAG: type I DNA topoisomerase [Balneolales bacterium]
MRSLVIVESPTKAKTIKKFLGNSYSVDSCNGHIRDLPASAKEVPAKYKKEKWSNLGINVDKDFEPLYVISSQKKKTVKRLKDLISQADELILATDEDREGEGISWHLLEVLKPKIPVKRIVFHEITEEAINKALEGYRDVNMNLVHAQEARRIIDRLAGYTISPLLWKKIAPGLSAGRVQSVAVELLVQRERERMRFRSGTYWDLKARLNSRDRESTEFEAILTRLNEKRLATGKDFDEATGKLKKPDSVELLNEKAASSLREDLLKADWNIAAIEKNRQTRSPAPPFITSTLQQEANRRMGLSGRDAMRTAQKLYEEGFITYMRTDSTNLSTQAVNAARTAVESMYGQDYLYKSVRTYTKKSKGAQEAHEAIRPAGSEFVTPKDSGLTGIHLKMYEMIWKRTVATQMAEARLEFTTVTINAVRGETSADFRTTGKKILFPGFFRAYVEGSDDPEAQIEDQEKPLPDLKENDGVDCREINALAHETKPPARYTEATLVKQLEKEGVGRPSTYATIISTVQDRGYALKEGSALVPSFTAFAVSGLLEEHFPEMVDQKFTSKMEDRLDEIAIGKEDPIKYLTTYYSGESGLKAAVDRQESQIDPQTARRIDLPLSGMDELKVYVGRFGPYVQTGKDGEQVSTSLPVSLAPSDITVEKLQELLKQSEEGPISLGSHPETGLPIFVLTGRFGPYVQLGEPTEEKPKPKRVSLLKGMTMEEVDLELALKLLELPRSLGNHPETGKEIKAGVGRYGPFVVHDGAFKSLAKDDNVLTVELDRAVELLNQKKTGKARKASSVIRELGEHPESGTEINIMTGRYGPYIKYGKKNISLPKGSDPEKFQKYDALELIKTKM